MKIFALRQIANLAHSLLHLCPTLDTGPVFTTQKRRQCDCKVDCVWNVIAHADTREGKWKGNWRMECVASTLHTNSELVYPALLPLMHTPRLPTVDWTEPLPTPPPLHRPSVSPKDEICFLRVCHHISTRSKSSMLLRYFGILVPD